MTTTNAIPIGKSIGNILELDNNNSSGLISRQCIRFKIEINTSLPLALGFTCLVRDQNFVGLLSNMNIWMNIVLLVVLLVTLRKYALLLKN
jgi:hypothetical protein